MDIAALSALYGRKDLESPAPYEEGAGLYADAGRLWNSGPAQFGKDWEVDLGDDGPSGKGRTPLRKGRQFQHSWSTEDSAGLGRVPGPAAFFEVAPGNSRAEQVNRIRLFVQAFLIFSK